MTNKAGLFQTCQGLHRASSSEEEREKKAMFCRWLMVEPSLHLYAIDHDRSLGIGLARFDTLLTRLEDFWWYYGDYKSINVTK